MIQHQAFTKHKSRSILTQFNYQSFSETNLGAKSSHQSLQTNKQDKTHIFRRTRKPPTSELQTALDHFPVALFVVTPVTRVHRDAKQSKFHRKSQRSRLYVFFKIQDTFFAWTSCIFRYHTRLDTELSEPFSVDLNVLAARVFSPWCCNATGASTI